MRTIVLSLLAISGCSVGGAPSDAGLGACVPGAQRCELGRHLVCQIESSVALEVATECTAVGLTCDRERGCVVCVPSSLGCDGAHVGRCRPDGSGWEPVETCDVSAGFACRSGTCDNLCARAEEDRAHLGCEFRAVDLDNGIDGLLTAGAQQYALVIANPSGFAADVVIEADEAVSSAPAAIREVARRTVAPGATEVFELPATLIDGASSADRNDGTHSALSRVAYRVRSTFPVAAYQFNPLQPRDTFSADASLLLPTSAWGQRYTVIGWPQTQGNLPSQTGASEHRATLTVAARELDTVVTVVMGPRVRRVMGSADFPETEPGDRLEVRLGPFGVLNLETEGRNADFSGTVVEANHDVAVFTGSEAANAPLDETSTVPAADHLEEQLLPDRSLGRSFVVGSVPSRTLALSAAFVDPSRSPVVANDEASWIRVLNVGERTAEVQTDLPSPNDQLELEVGEVIDLLVLAGTRLESTEPLSVVQAIGGQGITSIPDRYPGGDPALFIVPPLGLFRDSHVVLVPPHYSFDTILVTAPAGASGTIDGRSFDALCSRHPASAGWIVFHCPISTPVLSDQAPLISRGFQDDGVHRIEATQGVGVTVYGWDRFISYAYPGALQTVLLE